MREERHCERGKRSGILFSVVRNVHLTAAQILRSSKDSKIGKEDKISSNASSERCYKPSFAVPSKYQAKMFSKLRHHIKVEITNQDKAMEHAFYDNPPPPPLFLSIAVEMNASEETKKAYSDGECH